MAVDEISVLEAPKPPRSELVRMTGWVALSSGDPASLRSATGRMESPQKGTHFSYDRAIYWQKGKGGWLTASEDPNNRTETV
jgi:hypothetical protein